VTPERIEDEAGGWHRLHPLSPLVRAGPIVSGIIVVLVTTYVLRSGSDTWGSFAHAFAPALLVVLGVVSWLVTRWRIEGGHLRIETGLLRRSSLRFPLSQIQAIDTVRPLLARLFGLAELRLRMGGSTGTNGRLAYLPAHDAEVLRARLLALAHGAPTDVVAPPPEEVLVSVPVGRLVASILLSRLGLFAEALALAMIVGAFLAPDAVGAVIGAGAVPIIALSSVIWQRFNGEYRLTVAEAPDGLRLRSGLLATTAETILRGRVQAVRMTEPLLWRPLGWCRLEVDIAGRQHRKRESSAEGRPLRAVLPVGSRDEARGLLMRILPDAPEERLPAPGRARLKTPLRYRCLAWARTDTCAVTTSGRVARTTAWVPLAKVQSLRHVQGPAQRRLRLATVRLDVAGRSVRAAIRDRDEVEADEALRELTELCRLARRADRHALLRARPADSR
jgi:putative membrane protein